MGQYAKVGSGAQAVSWGGVLVCVGAALDACLRLGIAVQAALDKLDLVLDVVQLGVYLCTVSGLLVIGDGGQGYLSGVHRGAQKEAVKPRYRRVPDHGDLARQIAWSKQCGRTRGYVSVQGRACTLDSCGSSDHAADTRP